MQLKSTEPQRVLRVTAGVFPSYFETAVSCCNSAAYGEEEAAGQDEAAAFCSGAGVSGVPGTIT